MMVRHNLAAAYCAALVLRYNGGGVIAQGNGDDDDNSNADDGSSVSLNPAGSPTSSDVAADHPDCPGYISHIKDGYCDTDLNNAECGFDGGDCCACTCGSDDDDGELLHSCGRVGDGFDCKDPDVPADCGTTPSPAASFGYPDCTGYMYDFQNSYCNEDLNNAACGYDGGDCCRCTCRDYDGRYYSCGAYGYDCMDPEAPSSCSTDNPTPSPAAGTDYPDCDGYTYTIGDGECDSSNNNEGCAWDGGDCCACTCESDYGFCGTYGYNCLDPEVSSSCTGSPTPSPAAGTDYPDCDGYTNMIGDGDCDSSNNNEGCAWDGGDCCACTCESDYGYCGTYGYDCMDPEVSSSCGADSPTPSPAVGTDYPECDGSIFDIGDGLCDSSNNNEGCAWDGGDCCACTCENDYGYCGTYGYNCLDPTVITDCSSSSSFKSMDSSLSTSRQSYDQGCGFSGNGMCNSSHNNAECNWDGGDCCYCTCDGDSCGSAGYDCLDPEAYCYGSNSDRGGLTTSWAVEQATATDSSDQFMSTNGVLAVIGLAVGCFILCGFAILVSFCFVGYTCCGHENDEEEKTEFTEKSARKAHEQRRRRDDKELAAVVAAALAIPRDISNANTSSRTAHDQRRRQPPSNKPRRTRVYRNQRPSVETGAAQRRPPSSQVLGRGPFVVTGMADAGAGAEERKEEKVELDSTFHSGCGDSVGRGGGGEVKSALSDGDVAIDGNNNAGIGSGDVAKNDGSGRGDDVLGGDEDVVAGVGGEVERELTDGDVSVDGNAVTGGGVFDRRRGSEGDDGGIANGSNVAPRVFEEVEKELVGDDVAIVGDARTGGGDISRNGGSGGDDAVGGGSDVAGDGNADTEEGDVARDGGYDGGHGGDHDVVVDIEEETCNVRQEKTGETREDKEETATVTAPEEQSQVRTMSVPSLGDKSQAADGLRDDRDGSSEPADENC